MVVWSGSLMPKTSYGSRGGIPGSSSNQGLHRKRKIYSNDNSKKELRYCLISEKPDGIYLKHKPKYRWKIRARTVNLAILSQGNDIPYSVNKLSRFTCIYQANVIREKTWQQMFSLLQPMLKVLNASLYIYWISENWMGLWTCLTLNNL